MVPACPSSPPAALLLGCFLAACLLAPAAAFQAGGPALRSATTLASTPWALRARSRSASSAPFAPRLSPSGARQGRGLSDLCRACAESSPSSSMTLSAAEALLRAYDAKHQDIAKKGSEGLGGGTTATKWANEYEDKEALREAVMVMSSKSTRLMMGICASDAREGVDALKAWVGSLSLTKGRLHGMDKDGVPIDMSDFGAVYIKYTSAGGELSEPGDAMLNGYGGDFRGVYFAPTLEDGEFRQYAVLPLSLFSGKGAGVGGLPSLKEDLLAPLAPMLTELGARAEVAAYDQTTGHVTIRFEGAEALKFGIEDSLRGDQRVKSVAFVAF